MLRFNYQRILPFAANAYRASASSFIVCLSPNHQQYHHQFRFSSSSHHHQQQQQQQLQIQPLRTVLNQFKRAGAHPDLISMIDAEKASQNGKMLMELEQALQDRQDETWRKQQAQKILGLDEDEAEKQGVMKLKFWIRRPNNNSSSAAHEKWEGQRKITPAPSTLDVADARYQDPLESAKQLFKVECELTPYRPDHVVQKQLESLFLEAGIDTPFEVKSINSQQDQQQQETPKDLKSKLEHALYYRNEVMNDTSASSLMSRCNFATNVLRSRGVVLAIRDSQASSYLVTMPEKPKNSLDVASSSAQFTPNWDMDQISFIRDRGFQPFDLKTIVTETAAETIVDKIEQLAQWYLTVQGTTLRPGVCYLIENNDKKKQCSVTSDGCISLPMLAPHIWQDFLFGLSQPEWKFIVKSQEQWRSHQAELLRLRKSHLSRIADMLNVHKIELKAAVGSMNDKWVNAFCDSYLKEEVAIRKTVDRYASELQNIRMKQKGIIEMVPQNAEKSVKPKLCTDGTLIIPADLPPIQVLKFLKQEQRLAKAAKSIENLALVESHLEHIGHIAQLKIGIDKQWKKSTDKDIVVKLKQCVNTLRFSQKALTSFSRRGGRSGFTIMICDEDRYSTVSSMMSSVAMNKSGVIPIHWGIKAEDLSRSLLAQ